MLLHPKKASCVVLGTFNIYIFSPDWVAKVFELRDPNEILLEVDLNSPGLKLASSEFGFEWFVRPDRVAFESTGSTASIASAALRVVKRLPETPLRGVGQNFTYSVACQDLCPQTRSFLQHMLDTSATLESAATALRVIQGSQRYNLVLTIPKENRDEATVTINVHTDIREKGHPLACQVIECFDEHRLTAEAIVRQLWNGNRIDT